VKSKVGRLWPIKGCHAKNDDDARQNEMYYAFLSPESILQNKPHTGKRKSYKIIIIMTYAHSQKLLCLDFKSEREMSYALGDAGDLWCSSCNLFNILHSSELHTHTHTHTYIHKL
jgi:hypothetical protein